MLDYISKFFSKRRSASLTQDQNEALVDAMAYAIVIDRHVAAQEQEQLAAELNKLAWLAAVPADQYALRAMERAREAMRVKGGPRSYCERISARLGSRDLRAEAYEVCSRIAEADGEVAPEERELLEIMASAFGVSDRDA